jgi:hypothetical protein
MRKKKEIGHQWKAWPEKIENFEYEMALNRTPTVIFPGPVLRSPKLAALSNAAVTNSFPCCL